LARYDFQLSAIHTRADDLASVQSADLTSQIFSGTVSWTPLNRLYLQGSLSYVVDTTDTPAADLTTAVQNSENDYWTVSVGAGYALDDKTDLNVQYAYYRANNYSANYAEGLPYGAGFENNAVTATLTRRLSRRVSVSLKYGFFASNDETSGGHDDYDAHLVYTSLQYRF
jgi:predicted porin